MKPTDEALGKQGRVEVIPKRVLGILPLPVKSEEHNVALRPAAVPAIGTVPYFQ